MGSTNLIETYNLIETSSIRNLLNHSPKNLTLNMPNSSIQTCVFIFMTLQQSFAMSFFNSNALQCDRPNSKICLNGGACVDFSKLRYKSENKEVSRVYLYPQMSCQCPQKFFGPHCEYAIDDFL